MKFYQVLLLAICLAGCNEPVFRDGKTHVYRMISYDSKEWINDWGYQEIKIYPDNQFVLIVEGKIDDKGLINLKGDSLNFVTDSLVMPAIFLDTYKTNLRLYRSMEIPVTAKWEVFKKVE